MFLRLLPGPTQEGPCHERLRTGTVFISTYAGNWEPSRKLRQESENYSCFHRPSCAQLLRPYPSIECHRLSYLPGRPTTLPKLLFSNTLPHRIRRWSETFIHPSSLGIPTAAPSRSRVQLQRFERSMTVAIVPHLITFHSPLRFLKNETFCQRRQSTLRCVMPIA